MYLHLGQDVVIRTCDVVAIFDIENSSIAKSTKSYLYRAQKEGRVINVTYEMPKSFVVCAGRKDGKSTVYISQISPATLRKRAEFIDNLSNI